MSKHLSQKRKQLFENVRMVLRKGGTSSLDVKTPSAKEETAYRKGPEGFVKRGNVIFRWQNTFFEPSPTSSAPPPLHEPGVGVGFDEVDAAVGAESEIDAGVVAEVEGAEGGDGYALDLIDDFLGEIAGWG